MQMARPITSLSSSTGRRSSRITRSHHTLLKRTQPRRCINASALAIASVDNVDAVALAAVIGAIAGSVTTAMKTTTAAAAAAAAQTANWGARITTEVNRQSEEGISAAAAPQAQPAAHSATSYEAEEAGANPSGYSLALDAMQPAAAAALMCCAARALSNELVRSQDASLVFARAKARACRQFTTSGASPANRGGTTAALEAVQELTTPNALAPLTRNDDDDDDDDDTSIISNASSPMSEITRKYDALVMAMSKDPNAALADESTRSLLEDMAVRVADAAADEFIGNVLMANPSSGAAVAPPPATSLLRDDLHSTRDREVPQYALNAPLVARERRGGARHPRGPICSVEHRAAADVGKCRCAAASRHAARLAWLAFRRARVSAWRASRRELASGDVRRRGSPRASRVEPSRAPGELRA